MKFRNLAACFGTAQVNSEPFHLFLHAHALHVILLLQSVFLLILNVHIYPVKLIRFRILSPSVFDLHYLVLEVTGIPLWMSSYDMVHDFLLSPDHQSKRQYMPEIDLAQLLLFSEAFLLH